MPDISGYDRQRREADAYNLFFSSLTARADPSLSERGWFVPAMFAEFRDTRNDLEISPDFVLYDGDICLLVEIKSGNNIEERHIRQMRRCRSFSIDAIENELENAQVDEKTPYDGSVRTVDSCIIYQDMNEEYIRNCRSEWEDCREALERVENETAILTQDFGGQLRHLAGSFESNRLDRLFDEGIELPQNPKNEVMITENMEKEILAVAICDVWGETAVNHEDPVSVNVTKIRNHFAPRFNLPSDRVNRVLYYLNKIGACDHVDGLEYEFRYGHLSEVLTIEQTVREHPVDEFLTDDDKENIPDESQVTFDEVLAEEEATDTEDRSDAE